MTKQDIIHAFKSIPMQELFEIRNNLLSEIDRRIEENIGWDLYPGNEAGAGDIPTYNNPLGDEEEFKMS